MRVGAQPERGVTRANRGDRAPAREVLADRVAEEGLLGGRPLLAKKWGYLTEVPAIRLPKVSKLRRILLSPAPN